MLRLRIPIVILIALLGTLLLPSFAAAQTTLNQAKLAAGLGGCDTPGYPLTICKPGSYKLIGPLGFDATRPLNANIVHITASLVTLDLNGFFVGGACLDGLGMGVLADSDTVGIAVINGAVTCMGTVGIYLSTQSRVERVYSGGNGGTGIRVGASSIVRDNIVRQNNAGIEAVNSVISGNIADSNIDGIISYGGSTLNGNTAHDNTGFAFSLTATDGYLHNVLSNNTRNVFGGRNLGHNLCNGGPCP